jgi:hypothetical protein
MGVMANPSSVYCEGLGYLFRTESGPGGEYGVCVLPGGVECEAWAFLKGECGSEHNVCGINDLATEVRSDGLGWLTDVYAVCVASGTEGLQGSLTSQAAAMENRSVVDIVGLREKSVRGAQVQLHSLQQKPAKVSQDNPPPMETQDSPPSAFSWKSVYGKS